MLRRHGGARPPLTQAHRPSARAARSGANRSSRL